MGRSVAWLALLAGCVGPDVRELDPLADALVLAGLRIGDERSIVVGGDTERGPGPNVWIDGADEAAWELELAGGRRLYDVAFLDAEHGFVGGYAGAFLETRDGGRSWSLRPRADDVWIAGLAARGGVLLVAGAAGSAPLLQRSDDRGVTFVDLDVPGEGSLRDVCWVDDEVALAVGTGGLLLRSTDGGRTFAPVPTDTDVWLRAIAVGPCGAVAIAGHGVLLTSDDRGHTWRQHPLAGHKVNDLAWGGEGRLLLATMGGALLSWTAELGARELLAPGGRAWTWILECPSGARFVAGDRRAAFVR